MVIASEALHADSFDIAHGLPKTVPIASTNDLKPYLIRRFIRGDVRELPASQAENASSILVARSNTCAYGLQLSESTLLSNGSMEERSSAI
jgi:hypothetical protein